jgi:AbrB family looped-hinge helix DNA binding protein
MSRVEWYLQMAFLDHNSSMTSTLTLDKAGRIVLPKQVRDELQLAPGDVMEVASTGEEITLRPLRQSDPLRKEHGVWIFRAEKPLSHACVERVRKRNRAEREAGSLNKRRRRSNG